MRAISATGLATPAGLAVFKNNVHVAEWGMGRISKINEDGTKEILDTEGLSSPWGLMVYENEMYVAENGSNQISKVSEIKIPVRDRIEEGLDTEMVSFQDSITVWKVTSMNCTGEVAKGCNVMSKNCGVGLADGPTVTVICDAGEDRRQACTGVKLDVISAMPSKPGASCRRAPESAARPISTTEIRDVE